MRNYRLTPEEARALVIAADTAIPNWRMIVNSYPSDSAAGMQWDKMLRELTSAADHLRETQDDD